MRGAPNALTVLLATVGDTLEELVQTVYPSNLPEFMDGTQDLHPLNEFTLYPAGYWQLQEDLNSLVDAFDKHPVRFDTRSKIFVDRHNVMENRETFSYDPRNWMSEKELYSVAGYLREGQTHLWQSTLPTKLQHLLRQRSLQGTIRVRTRCSTCHAQWEPRMRWDRRCPDRGGQLHNWEVVDVASNRLMATPPQEDPELPSDFVHRLQYEGLVLTTTVSMLDDMIQHYQWIWERRARIHEHNAYMFSASHSLKGKCVAIPYLWRHHMAMAHDHVSRMARIQRATMDKIVAYIVRMLQRSSYVVQSRSLTFRDPNSLQNPLNLRGSCFANWSQRPLQISISCKNVMSHRALSLLVMQHLQTILRSSTIATTGLMRMRQQTLNSTWFGWFSRDRTPTTLEKRPLVSRQRTSDEAPRVDGSRLRNSTHPHLFLTSKQWRVGMA